MKKYILYILLALFIATPVCAQHRVVSYKQGFYTPQRGGIPLNPNLWRGLEIEYATSLGNTGISTMQDVSGHKHVGIMSGFTGSSWANSPIGNVLTYIDGTTSIENPVSTFNSFPITLTVWTQGTNGDTTQTITGLADTTTSTEYITLGIRNGNYAIVARFGATNIRTEGSITPDADFHFLVGVFHAADDRELYVDGVFNVADTTSVTIPTPINIAVVGELGRSARDAGFGGLIGDTGFYRKALLPSQIMQLFTDQQALFRTRRLAIGRVPDGVPAARRRFWISQLMERVTGGMAEMYMNN